MNFLGFAVLNVVVTVGIGILGDYVSTSKAALKAQEERDAKAKAKAASKK